MGLCLSKKPFNSYVNNLYTVLSFQCFYDENLFTNNIETLNMFKTK
ncbi:hypothetical protein BMWSH_2323 [Priestia megaterium WSH-002]|uniref:Uncharacterized protein n=1 Tax=Priestia megaterium (strain WSH-002) TaxID=1006007 RepID=A0A8D3X1L1_PRIMW|nr:hypothetical protein BMWSH_2323 [Priestia megaterium WSH-002]